MQGLGFWETHNTAPKGLPDIEGDLGRERGHRDDGQPRKSGSVLRVLGLNLEVFKYLPIVFLRVPYYSYTYTITEPKTLFLLLRPLHWGLGLFVRHYELRI